MTDLSHDKVLTPANVGWLSFDNRLQEPEVVYLPPMRLNAVYKVLHHTLCNITAQGHIVLENGTHGLCLQNLSSIKKTRMTIIRIFVDDTIYKSKFNNTMKKISINNYIQYYNLI